MACEIATTTMPRLPQTPPTESEREPALMKAPKPEAVSQYKTEVPGMLTSADR